MAICHSSSFVFLFYICLTWGQVSFQFFHSADEQLLHGHVFLPHLEAPIGGRMDIVEFGRKFPHIARLANEQETITLPADPKVGLTKPTTIQFLEIINTGQFSAVMKASMNGDEEIAFKVFRPRTSGPSMFQERQETLTMKYLSTHMEEVVKPKCGTKVHFFNVDGVEFRGIGMELFPFPTLAEYFKSDSPSCMTSMGAIGICLGNMLLSQDRKFNPNNEAMRIELLHAVEVRRIYEYIVGVLCKFWSLGVVHEDLHANNILYDGNARRAKVIDWGMAQRPVASQYMKFILAVCSDLYRFTYTFAFAVMYPQKYHSIYEKLTNQEEYMLNNEIKKLSQHIRGMIGVGVVPKTPQFEAVWVAFRNQHNMPNPHVWPRNTKLISFLRGEFDIHWDRNDDNTMLGAVPKVAPSAPPPVVDDPQVDLSPPIVVAELPEEGGAAAAEVPSAVQSGGPEGSKEAEESKSISTSKAYAAFFGHRKFWFLFALMCLALSHSVAQLRSRKQLKFHYHHLEEV